MLSSAGVAWLLDDLFTFVIYITVKHGDITLHTRSEPLLITVMTTNKQVLSPQTGNLQCHVNA